MAYTRTHRYLYPGVGLGYDDGFTNFLLDHDALIINSFLGDMDYENTVPACIFVLMKKTTRFESIQKYLKSHKSYFDDYHSGKFDSDLHMFIMKVPNERMYNYFVLSKYSKMYEKKFLDKYFKRPDGTCSESYHILAKSEQKYSELLEKYNLTVIDIPEYDSCIKMQEEVYNFQITNV